MINEDEKAAYRHRGVVSGFHDCRNRDLIGVRKKLVGRKSVWNHECATPRSNQAGLDDHDEFDLDEFDHDEFDLDDDHRARCDVVAAGAGWLLPDPSAGQRVAD
ncbi:MAG: hypothetical protein ACLPVY_11235 [Acidimicrobiia bacterium]